MGHSEAAPQGEFRGPDSDRSAELTFCPVDKGASVDVPILPCERLRMAGQDGPTTTVHGGIAAIALACAAFACLSPAPARADAVADFYKDKTITLVSAGEAGGAHGTYAQLLVQHFRRHVPGNPNIVIQH